MSEDREPMEPRPRLSDWTDELTPRGTSALRAPGGRLWHTCSFPTAHHAYTDRGHCGPCALDDNVKCRCGHERRVHAGLDGLGRCVLRSCPTMCGQFRPKQTEGRR